MARFHRDGVIRCVTIDAQALSRINDFLQRVARRSAEDPPNARRDISLDYVIRFDNKGYGVADFADVQTFYEHAAHVERVVFNAGNQKSRATNGLEGMRIQLRLDAHDINGCFFVASSDDREWVDASFNGLTELLQRQLSSSRFVRPWIGFAVQLFGVLLGFAISLWGALNIAPYLNIENSFAVSLIFVFLLFSNIWTFGNAQIIRLIEFLFPNLRFAKKDDRHWLFQAVVGSLLSAVVLGVLLKLYEWLGSVLVRVVK